MKNIIIQEEVKQIEERLRVFEDATGCDLLLVVAKSSDPYPAASWRFGLVSAFSISLLFSLYFEFQHAYFWPLGFFSLAVLMTWLGGFDWAKRLALSNWETARECQEKSIEYFHTMGTSKVNHKVTAMIMISVLEKRIHVLVDEKLREKLSQRDLDDLVIGMKTHFKDGNTALGFIRSIENLEAKILTSFSGRVSNAQSSELSDTIHFVN